MTRSRTAAAALACAVLSAALVPCASARSIRQPQLMDEITQQIAVDHEIAFAIWMPPKAFLDDMPPKERERFMKSMEGYSIFLVMDGEMSPMANLTAKSRKELVATMSLNVEGKTYTPLSDAAVPADLRMIGEMMKPVMKNLLGNLGQQMEMVVFADADANGRTLMREDGTGDASLSMSARTFTWHLPLASLLPPMEDRDNGDTFPGDYAYSPFSGRKLVPKK
jgi:hypothetical protein